MDARRSRANEAPCAECGTFSLVETMHSTDGTCCLRNGLLCADCFAYLSRLVDREVKVLGKPWDGK